MILTIGMIVKNESKYLKMCLEAIKPILNSVDSELIIVDTGSTDNTVDIAREFTDKIYFHKWNNSFAEARNITIDKAKGQWYFYIDGDEILKNPGDIVSFFKSDKCKKFKACAIKIKNIIDENCDLVVPELFSSRLVKLDSKVRFEGRIHEKLPGREPLFFSEAYLTHYGYVNTDERLMEYKFLRNRELLKKAIEEEPNNYYLLYQLANTYQMHRDYKKATKYLETAYNIVRNLKIYPMYIYNLLAQNYLLQSRFFEAEKVCKEALANKKIDSTAYFDTYFNIANSQNAQGKYGEAIESYNNYLKLLDSEKEEKLTVDFSIIVCNTKSYNYVYLQLSYLYDKIENLDKAVQYARAVLNSEEKNENQEVALKQLVYLWSKYSRYDKIVSFYEEIVDTSDSDMNKENIYIIFLEEEMRESFSAKKEIINILAKVERYTDYILLNKIRFTLSNNEKLDECDINNIKLINFKGNLNIYGELIYYLMKQSIDISEILDKLNDKDLNNYLEYLAEKFNDLPKVISLYFEKYQDVQNINYALFSKALKRVYLIKEKIEDTAYVDLFKRYVEEGIFYIEQIYKGEILDNENDNILKNEEEVFFMYMRKAYLNKEKNVKVYISYLNKALNAYIYMKKGIEILSDELSKELQPLEKQSSVENMDFQGYKKVVKNNINMLVEAKKISEAKLLIDEYLKIVPDDLEMLALKSEIQLKFI